MKRGFRTSVFRDPEFELDSLPHRALPTHIDQLTHSCGLLLRRGSSAEESNMVLVYQQSVGLAEAGRLERRVRPMTCALLDFAFFI
jgi:hypothetical protein